MNLAAAHRAVGIVTLVGFVTTGVVLRLHHPPLSEADLGLRMLLRSRHVYLLVAGLVHLLLGSYFRPAGSPAARIGQRAGSLLLVLAVAVLALAFQRDARLAFPSMLGPLGLLLLAAGAIIHAIAGRGVASGPGVEPRVMPNPNA